MTTLLHVGSPTVWVSFWGDRILDDGGIPVRVADRRAAYAEAAARQIVPPAGDLLTQPGQQIATPRWAGSNPTVAAPPAAGGRAPESFASASPSEAGSGAPNGMQYPIEPEAA